MLQLLTNSSLIILPLSFRRVSALFEMHLYRCWGLYCNSSIMSVEPYFFLLQFTYSHFLSLSQAPRTANNCKRHYLFSCCAPGHSTADCLRSENMAGAQLKSHKLWGQWPANSHWSFSYTHTKEFAHVFPLSAGHISTSTAEERPNTVCSFHVSHACDTESHIQLISPPLLTHGHTHTFNQALSTRSRHTVLHLMWSVVLLNQVYRNEHTQTQSGKASFRSNMKTLSQVCGNVSQETIPSSWSHLPSFYSLLNKGSLIVSKVYYIELF